MKLTKAQRDQIEGLLDDIEGAVSELRDACANHESAEDKDEREEAVEAIVEQIGELLVSVATLRALREKVEAT